MRLRSAAKLSPYELVSKTSAMTPASQMALAAALKNLRGRDRFQEEVRATCIDAGCEDEAIEQALEYLRQKRIIDDVRLTRNEAARLARRKLWPRARISAVLEARGAPPEAIETALDTLPTEAAIAVLWAKKFKGDKLRLGTRLRAAGFDEDAVEEVVNQ
ncbi:MAG: RecX family transcriptional regulator [Armatimonadetes bacterium]|nr:RecX family transcriptional regulator [Armatimonadota bacterium]